MMEEPQLQPLIKITKTRVSWSQRAWKVFYLLCLFFVLVPLIVTGVIILQTLIQYEVQLRDIPYFGVLSKVSLNSKIPLISKPFFKIIFGSRNRTKIGVGEKKMDLNMILMFIL